MIAPPVGFSLTPSQIRTPPPKHGEHTDSVLRDLVGLDDATIQAYRARGII
jgi:crotonobetainyl-CoA:carnitine CoA-transferase CaiB-like acyl-CoA transferase